MLSFESERSPQVCVLKEPVAVFLGDGAWQMKLSHWWEMIGDYSLATSCPLLPVPPAYGQLEFALLQKDLVTCSSYDRLQLSETMSQKLSHLSSSEVVPVIYLVPA